MMWEEFERLAGYEVTYDDYTNIIEPMYMATNLNKQEFIATLDRKRFDRVARERAEKAAMVKAMREIATERAANCEHFGDWESESRLIEIAREYVRKWFPAYLKPHGDIERRHWIDDPNACTYPADLVIYSEADGWKEIERVKLARSKRN